MEEPVFSEESELAVTENTEESLDNDNLDAVTSLLGSSTNASMSTTEETQVSEDGDVSDRLPDDSSAIVNVISAPTSVHTEVEMETLMDETEVALDSAAESVDEPAVMLDHADPALGAEIEPILETTVETNVEPNVETTVDVETTADEEMPVETIAENSAEDSSHVIESVLSDVSTFAEDDEKKPADVLSMQASNEYIDDGSNARDYREPSYRTESSRMFQHLDRFGFSKQDDFRMSLMVDTKDAEARRRREIKRERKWLLMVKDKDWSNSFFSKKRFFERLMSPSYKKLKSRVRKGIPDAWRGRVWIELLQPHFDENMAKYPYLIDVELSELTTEDIEKDLERTFPRHEMFCHGGVGQDSLRRVLRAYANVDPEVGYCQGMSFIAGLFLMYMPEDCAFCGLLTALHRQKPLSAGPKCNLALRSMFLPTLAEVQRVLFVFEKLLRLHLPKLAQHFINESVLPSMYLTEWVMTMFCRGFSFDLVTRVWDIYLFEGYKIVYRVGLALLKILEKPMLAVPFEGIMETLRDVNKYADAEVVIKTALGIHLKRSEIVQFQEEYDANASHNY